MKSKLLWWMGAPLLLALAVGGTLWLRRTPTEPVATAPVMTAPVTVPIAVNEPPVATAAEEPSDMVQIEAAPCTLGLILRKEQRLIDNGIQLSMAYAPGGTSVRLVPPCPESAGQPFVALAPEGMEPLSGNATRTTTTIPWGCGADYQASELTATRALAEGDVPLVMGAQATKLLQWAPARPIDGNAECAPPQPGFVREREQLFEFAGREGRWSLASWKLPGADTETRVEGERRIATADVLSRIAADGTCATAATAEKDLDGYGFGKPPLQSIYGWLTFKNADIEKFWVLSNTPGSEGRGIAAIPLGPDREQLLMEAAVWDVYSGC